MSFPDIPPGKKLPLVDDTTNRLPDPTMDAIAASPELSATFGAEAMIERFGAVGNGTADDTAAFTAAFAYLSQGGVLILSPGKTYKTTGGHNARGVVIRGFGSKITHTGNNTLFNFNASTGSLLKRPQGIEGVWIEGNSGASAVGLEFGSAWGSFVKRSVILNYSAGVAVLCRNIVNWLEGFQIDGLFTEGCLKSLRFTRANDTTAWNSFGYLRLRDIAFNVPANGIGIDFDGTTYPLYIYNGMIEGTLWIWGANGVGMRITTGVDGYGMSYDVAGETAGGSQTGHAAIRATGGRQIGYGQFYIMNAPYDIDPSATIQISMQGRNFDTGVETVAADSFTPQLLANPNTPYNGAFGFIKGQNRGIPFVAGYSPNDAFRVYKTAFDQAVKDGTLLFRVTKEGYLNWGAAGDLVVRYGTGKPTSVSAPPGSLYVRTDGTAAGLAGHNTLFYKAYNTDATGWIAVSPGNPSGATAARPSSPDTGQWFWDSSLGQRRPIWWDGAGWRTANGARTPVQSVAGNRSILDHDETIVVTASGNTTQTLPLASDAVAGRVYRIKNIGTGTVTVQVSGGGLIDADATKTLTQWQVLNVLSTGTQWLVA